MQHHHTNYDNIVTWKIVQSDNRFSIVYSSRPMLWVGIPFWWAGLFVFCFLSYLYASKAFVVFVIPLGIVTAILQAIIVWYKLHKEKQRGDYLHLDLQTKTIELPQSHIRAIWDKQAPAFYVDEFDMGSEYVYEFNVQLDDGRCFPILRSNCPAFGHIISKLSRYGFSIQKRNHKD